MKGTDEVLVTDQMYETAKIDDPLDAAESDPLLALRGSGRALWADEHADEYVANLRREWQ